LRIAILPIGSVEGSILEEIRFSLSETFPDTDASILVESLSLPKETYEPNRDQINSNKMLLYIEALHHRFDADRILGVMEVDLYVPSLNFVFCEERAVCICLPYMGKHTVDHFLKRLKIGLISKYTRLYFPKPLEKPYIRFIVNMVWGLEWLKKP
jgi:hypothetical protein